MLILTRRVGERILIGEDIVVEVRGIHGTQVRVGVDAPRETRVDREELRERINRQQRKPQGAK